MTADPKITLGAGGRMIIFFFSAAAVAAGFMLVGQAPGAPEKAPSSLQRAGSPKSSAPTLTAAGVNAGIISAHVFLKVPFTSQAPFGDWSQPYKDACEEASVVMAMAWVNGEELGPERAKREILNQVAYEIYNFGYHRDTALRETLKIIRNFYGYSNAAVIYDISVEDIKRELAFGNLVIVPASGVVLENPYYASPPDYHMVVVRGYDDIAREFIVNDPGTKRGESYRYSYDTLYRAIGDLTGSGETIFGGRKGMIVVKPMKIY